MAAKSDVAPDAETGDGANEASGTKAQFIANFSHELRTPLNAIIGFAEMMRDQSFGPLGHEKYVEYNGIIHASGQHLLSIIDGILDISKVEAGKMTLNEDSFDLADVARRAGGLIGSVAQQSGVRLVLPPQTPVVLTGDERLVLQIVLNLLSNAVKFTPQGGTVSVDIRTPANGDTELSVRDTGIGIAPEHIQHVMTPFAQVEGAQLRSFKGTGLGLPLVKSFAELHGGTFALDSKVGQGTTATVTFPASRRVRT
jgi:signal transduction histidine kinase